MYIYIYIYICNNSNEAVIEEEEPTKPSEIQPDTF